MSDSKICELCGDTYHAEPDPPERKWMGLLCPGAKASDEDKAAFRTALAETYAAEVKRQAMLALERDDDYLERRHIDWENRTRDDDLTKAQLPTNARISARLQADVDARVETEVSRQKRDHVWQEPVFDIDIPHLTVAGKVPDRGLAKAPDSKNPEDFTMYVDPNPDA